MADTTSFVFKSSTHQTLGALKGCLKKAKAHALASDVDETIYLNARLFPDMLDAKRQVQIACDTVARGASRMAGGDIPSFPDTETTFDQLIARCDAALAHVNAIDDVAINANARVTLQIPMGPDTMPMEGRQYLSSFILPNLHFHAAMFYGLMRQQGVVLGKRDFLVPA